MPKHKDSLAAKIRTFIKKNPRVRSEDVAKEFGTTKQYVYAVIWKMKQDVKNKILRVAQEAAEIAVAKPKVAPLPIDMIETKPDPVNHPAHYKVGGIETIDFIEAKRLNYNIGNVVKYITRADHKGNRKQDLEKAKWYLERELSAIEGASHVTAS
jgi:hypothetical protein